MKKTIYYSLITFTLCLTLLFVGCGNTSKNLARNLDNTITNLVYSVSSLDWADEDLLNNIESSANQETNFQSDYEFKNFNNSQQFETLDNQNLKNIDQNNNIDLLNENNTATTPEPHLNNESLNNQNISNQHYNHPPYNYNNRSNRPYPPTRRLNNRDHFNTQPEHNPEYKYQNQDFSNKQLNNKYNFKSLYNSYNNTKRNLINNQQNLNEYESENSNIRTVTYSTSKITDNNSQMENKIGELLQARSSILLYINDLYKGNVVLNESNERAINAYINIIKDNTSYLNQNKGLITNQLMQANDLVSNNANSPLINAYIIRTNEAIETRTAKLDSSILAIESICKILQANLTNDSPNFSNDLSNITDNKYQLDKTLINNDNINTKISTNNKNANDMIETNKNNNLIDETNNENVKNTKNQTDDIQKSIYNIENNIELNSKNTTQTKNENSTYNTIDKNANYTTNNTNLASNNTDLTTNKNKAQICPECINNPNSEECQNCLKKKTTNNNDLNSEETTTTFSQFIDKNYRKNKNKPTLKSLDKIKNSTMETI